MTKAGCHCDKMPDKNCFALFKYFITVMRKVTNTDTSHPNTLTESSCAFSPYCSFILCLSLICVCARMRTFSCSCMPLTAYQRLFCSSTMWAMRVNLKSSGFVEVSTCWAIVFLWYKLFRKGFSHNVCWSLAFWLLWRSNTLWWGVQGTHLVTF